MDHAALVHMRTSLHHLKDDLARLERVHAFIPLDLL